MSPLLLLSLLSAAQAWWMLAELGDSTRPVHPSACSLIPGLSAKQRDLCARHPDAIKYMANGLRMAVRECQSAFADQLWNCTTNGRGFGTAPLKIASKESAYVYAIAAAGVTHSLAKACAKGLIADCGCGPTPATSPRSSTFVWSGCSDNVKYGNTFGRRFIDDADKQHSDARALMNLHNNRVGRRLLSKAVKKECKCHGVSGSCVTKTCWKVVPKFEEFALELKDKYEYAQQVTVQPLDTQLMVRPQPAADSGRYGRYLKGFEEQASGVKRDKNHSASKNELVFLDPSPDYCQTAPASSKGRECKEDACEQICCGRGYTSIREVVQEPCQCVFVWCCEVKCKTCSRVVERHYCR